MYTITRKDLLIFACILFLMITYTPAHAAPIPKPVAAQGNACYVQVIDTVINGVRVKGQYVVQTAGKTGTINLYSNGAYKTTISQLNTMWYVTNDLTAVVRGYDSGGIVC